MHVFLLILSIAGQPERIGAMCETYIQCSDEGKSRAAQYLMTHHEMPDRFSYRVIPAVIVPEGEET
jgi:hypothetical protein